MKKTRRTYTSRKPRAKRTVAKPKRKKTLPIKAFQQAIGRKFQTKESETHVVVDKKSKAKGRREGL
jgi:hypothetical protein